MNRIRLIILGCVAVVTLISITRASGGQPENNSPNVLILLADDQGWGDLSINGNTNLDTPAIDSLARDGALLEQFYVCPVCSPTRAELLTGRYHPRGGVRGVSSGGERLNLDEKTLAETFKAAGYATACFGKWHNGAQYPYHPNARGFQEFYGFCSGHWGHYFSPELQYNGKLVRGDGYVNDDFTNHAIKFIESHREKPFLCYVAFNTPHSPMQVPDRFFKKFQNAELAMRNRDPKKENLNHTRAALAMCENIDWNIGRMLRKLDNLNLTDQTIVVYFSDNGPNGWRFNGGMRGKKGSTDEGGVRAPCLIRWPGHIGPGTKVPQIAGAIDLLPTLADLAGIPATGSKPLDGKNIKPLLLGTAVDWPDRMIFSHWSGRVSVRTQQYRLDHQGRLYDMTADPCQYNNIAQQHPGVTRRLSKAVADWKKEVLGKKSRNVRPFTVGYPQFPVTYLPARDGKAHGGIRRSSRSPNCSYFTHGTNTNDRITWNIEVATPGRYEATVYYTCPKEDIGSTIELSFNGVVARARVDEPYDPPLIGAKQDRVERRESYVKDFKPLQLGTMELKAGRGLLTLRAVDVPGKQVMDIRRVSLTLLESN